MLINLVGYDSEDNIVTYSRKVNILCSHCICVFIATDCEDQVFVSQMKKTHITKRSTRHSMLNVICTSSVVALHYSWGINGKHLPISLFLIISFFSVTVQYVHQANTIL